MELNPLRVTRPNPLLTFKVWDRGGNEQAVSTPTLCTKTSDHQYMCTTMTGSRFSRVGAAADHHIQDRVNPSSDHAHVALGNLFF